jgi:hypothetical protein
MKTRRATRAKHRERGLTLAEIMVALVIGLIVIGAVGKIMILQSRGYGKQREVIDVRDTGRGAAALIAWELRHAKNGDSPLIAMNANSLTLRSVQGLGTICAKHATLARYALWRTGGDIQATTDDTALVYLAPKQQWRTLKISQVGTPAALGVPTCSWPGAPTPDLAVEFAVTSKWDTINIMRGAPLRNFRKVEYAEYLANGRWWLGRRIGGAVNYEPVTGPLLAPGSGGLSFAYYDTFGAVTANPALVAVVHITMRGQSVKQTSLQPGVMQFQQDTVTTKVAIKR